MRLFFAEFWGNVYILGFPCAVEYADQRPIFNKWRDTLDEALVSFV